VVLCIHVWKRPVKDAAEKEEFIYLATGEEDEVGGACSTNGGEEERV
jgi:hypothetical protein